MCLHLDDYVKYLSTHRLTLDKSWRYLSAVRISQTRREVQAFQEILYSPAFFSLTLLVVIK